MRRIIAFRTSPAAFGFMVAGMIVALAAGADGRIQTAGQRCGSVRSLSRTHNLSTEVTHRTLACPSGGPITFAHWYDLSTDPEFSFNNVILTCVEFTLWSSTSATDQEVFVRVFEDLTAGRSGDCGSLDDPGPDVAGAQLLWEGSVSYCPSTSGVDSTTTPRRDGYRTVPVGPDWNGDGTQDGLWLAAGTRFFVEVGAEGEDVVRFGANLAGEAGDPEGASSAEVTWVRQSTCSGGGCSSSDYVKHSEWSPAIDRDFILVLHFELADATLPAPLPVCPEDVSGPDSVPDGRVDIMDLLALLATWGQWAPPRPTGDVAPRYFGDNTVDIDDLLAQLAAWGDCPNPRADCIDVTHRLPPLENVGEGVHPFLIDGPLDGPRRFATNETSVFQCETTTCGWHDYGEAAIGGAFRYGDAFGINAATGAVGGDIWFVYVPSFTGTARLSTQSLDGCPPEEAADTMIEVYPVHNLSPCANQWNERIACDDSSATGCGDHAQLTIPVTTGTRYLVRIAGKFGEQGAGTLTIEPEP